MGYAKLFWREYIMRILTVTISVLLALFSKTNLFACTGFCISNETTVLVGNNEDWKDPNTKVWYEPSENGKFGRVYFGFDNFFPQGGMNEMGLCFDGFATEPKKVIKSLHKPEFEGNNLLDYIMSKCKTVDDVIQEFDKYNLSSMDRAMLFFADADGDAAIIEGDEIIRKKDHYQIITNFYQSEVKGENIKCQRFKIANQMFKNSDEVSIDFCKRVLAATHNEGTHPTVYSNIYDLKEKVVYVYHFHNFQNEVVINLAEELKKGARRIDLPSLFPKTYVAEKFQSK